jgi:hypothetical protein
MVAVATPPTRVPITSPAERFSMEASNGEERLGIRNIWLWRILLDTDPSPDEEVQLFLAQASDIFSDIRHLDGLLRKFWGLNSEWAGFLL